MTSDKRTYRIAIIDDSSGDRAELKSLLLRGSPHRFEFFEAATGAEGMHICHFVPGLDCVVLDYEMPDMNALAFLSGLQQDNLLTGLPVVILTGMDDRYVGTAVMRAGAQDFVGKDWLTSGSIWRAVENAMDRHNASLELARRSKRQSLLLELTTRIHSGYRDEASLLSIVCLQIAADLRAEMACACLPGSTGDLKITWQVGIPEADVSEIDSKPIGALLCMLADNDKNFFYADAETLATHPEAEYLRQLGATAYASYKLVSEDARPLAVLSFATAQRDEFSEEELKFIETLCQTLSVAFERGRAETELRESNRRLRHAGESAGIGFWSWDVALSELTFDATCARLLGLPSHLGVPLSDVLALLHPVERPQLELAAAEAITTLGRFEIEFRTMQPDGQNRWMIGFGQAVCDGEGPVRLSGVMLDITERKSGEQERARLLDSERFARLNAEREGRVKDEFLATLSHELRTPLSAILGWTHIISESQLSKEDFQNGLQVIKRNAQIQAQLIEELLDMSRIISGKIRLEMQQIDVADVIEAALETVMPAAEAKGVRVVGFPERNIGLVTGDAARLQQVIWNLLSNAVKFTPRDGTIGIELQRVDSHIDIAISDSGSGIPAEFLPYVFDRFRQVDGASNRQNGGLGLGLSIVRHLIELHGGTVRAHSAGLGQGAVFTVCLPLAAVRDLKRDQQKNELAGSSLPDGETPAAPRLEGCLVLVVDDVADSREVLKRFLAEAGARVALASSAAEAIQEVYKERPDVLVSDIGMPNEDGYELLRQVRQLTPENEPGIPAIALTAFASSSDRERAISAGFQIHAAKPVDPVNLVTMVAALAGKSS